MADPRVIVVGAGPAGVRAAQTLVEAGLRPIVIDEGRRDGGQIYRRQPEGFARSYPQLYGTEAQKPRTCTTASRRCGRASTTGPRRWRGTSPPDNFTW